MKEIPILSRSAAAPAYPADFAKNLVPQSSLASGQLPDEVVLQPLVNFQPDIVIPPNQTVVIPVTTLLNKCVGFVITNVTALVQYSVNGGGFRSLYGTVVIDGAVITQLAVNGGTAGCIVQLMGV
jgi:hypothetical protein